MLGRCAWFGAVVPEVGGGGGLWHGDSRPWDRECGHGGLLGCVGGVCRSPGRVLARRCRGRGRL